MSSKSNNQNSQRVNIQTREIIIPADHQPIQFKMDGKWYYPVYEWVNDNEVKVLYATHTGTPIRIETQEQETVRGWSLPLPTQREFAAVVSLVTALGVFLSMIV